MFLLDHIGECTPMEPCPSCQAAQILKDKLDPKDYARIRTFARDALDAVKVEQPNPKLDVPWQKILLENTVEISARLRNCLLSESSDTFTSNPIKTMRDVISRTKSEWLEVPNFGKKSLNELKDVLNKLGYFDTQF